MTVLCEEIEYLALATLSMTLRPGYNHGVFVRACDLW